MNHKLWEGNRSVAELHRQLQEKEEQVRYLSARPATRNVRAKKNEGLERVQRAIDSLTSEVRAQSVQDNAVAEKKALDALNIRLRQLSAMVEGQRSAISMLQLLPHKRAQKKRDAAVLRAATEEAIEAEREEMEAAMEEALEAERAEMEAIAAEEVEEVEVEVAVVVEEEQEEEPAPINTEEAKEAIAELEEVVKTSLAEEEPIEKVEVAAPAVVQE